MANHVEQATEYRMCAERARKLALEVMPAEHRDSLLAIAESYDRLAKRLETGD